MDSRYATLCGYTDHDLDTVFAPELEGLDRDKIRHWYNGYHWLGKEKLYNPWDILLLFSDREFQDYWFKTGTPTMLYRQMGREQVIPMTLENQRVREDLISKFDVDDVDLSALMFQSGNLTVVKEELTEDDDMYFTLDYPNLEVQRSFTRGLLDRMGLDKPSVTEDSRALLDLLVANDFNGFGRILHKFISGIPHQCCVNNRIKNDEAHYASMLYLALKVNRADLIAEDSSNHGRADFVISEGRQVFVIEFKMADNEAGAESAIEDAMAQMKERGYAAKYRNRNEPIHLVAMIFGRKERNVIAIQAEHNGVAQTFSFD